MPMFVARIAMGERGRSLRTAIADRLARFRSSVPRGTLEGNVIARCALGVGQLKV
jgi:fluoride ion exporter CrcB/FEX